MFECPPELLVPWMWPRLGEHFLHKMTFLSHLSSDEAEKAQPRISYQLIFRLSPGSDRLKFPTEGNQTRVPHLIAERFNHQVSR